MPKEAEETLKGVPLQTYEISTSFISVSLGQGTSDLTPVPSLTLQQRLDRLDISPNDTCMWSSLPAAKEEDVPELIHRLQTRPSSAVLFLLIPHLPNPKFPDAIKTVINLDKDVIDTLLETIPSLATRAEILSLDTVKISEFWDSMGFQSRERLVPVASLLGEQLPIPRSFMPSKDDPAPVSVDVIKNVFDTQIQKKETSQSLRTGTSLRDERYLTTIEKVMANPFLRSLINKQDFLASGLFGTYTTAIPWNADLRVHLDRSHYRIIGSLGSSGKGLTIEAAMASGLMEFAERVSAIAGATPEWPEGYARLGGMVKKRLSDFSKEGASTVDPNEFSPILPYVDQEIYWIHGDHIPASAEKEHQKIWIPAQKVFHMTYLDEPMVLKESSNGLASGNTLDEAKLHALLEILERDGCLTMFSSPERMFTFAPGMPGELGDIMRAYTEKGLHPAFMDLTTEFGVPVYKAFIQLPDGNILSGSGAHLDGKIALNRAICELSSKCVSVSHQQKLEDLVQPTIALREYSDIPDLSSGNVKDDRRLIETLLRMNDYPIYYADLTRSDIDIPVVRAMVPGLDCPFGLNKREILHFLKDVHAVAPTATLYSKRG